MPSVLRHCWLGGRKSIWPVQNERCSVSVVTCLERGAHCLHMMPLHPKNPSPLASYKSGLVLPFWYRLTQTVVEKRPLNGCSSRSLCRHSPQSQYTSSHSSVITGHTTWSVGGRHFPVAKSTTCVVLPNTACVRVCNKLEKTTSVRLTTVCLCDDSSSASDQSVRRRHRIDKYLDTLLANSNKQDIMVNIQTVDIATSNQTARKALLPTTAISGR